MKGEILRPWQLLGCASIGITLFPDMISSYHNETHVLLKVDIVREGIIHFQ